jgi:hypothetical protein
MILIAGMRASLLPSTSKSSILGSTLTTKVDVCPFSSCEDFTPSKQDGNSIHETKGKWIPSATKGEIEDCCIE